MTEQEKCEKGLLYDANFDQEIVSKRLKCADLCFELNNCKPSDLDKQKTLVKQIFGEVKGDFFVTTPFYCDYGFNISIGNNFYTNHNCTILDAAKVTIGNNVYIGPNCVITTAGHALDAKKRAQGLEFAYPIVIEDDVWLGANVIVMPGITIGSGSVIGAGSVVTKDIPKNVIAYGNPCRVSKKILNDETELM